MHLAVLTATLAATVNPTTPDARPAANTAVAITAPIPTPRRPAWEPPGYPLDAESLAAVARMIPNSGDGGA